MRITDLLGPRRILLGTQAADKQEALQALLDALAADGCLKDKETFRQEVFAREEKGGTAVGGGVAIPHAKSRGVARPALAAMTLAEGIDWQAPDGAPVRLVFVIAAPADAANLHVEVLAGLARCLMQPECSRELIAAADPQVFMQTLDRWGEEKPAEDSGGGPYEVLAVTACPLGVAHTFMAAEALERSAAEMGIRIKVETNGADGPQNVLTEQEIDQARCIIVAANRTVESERFIGHPVLFVPVAEAVRQPERLLRRALTADLPPMAAPLDQPNEQPVPAPKLADPEGEEEGGAGAAVREHGRHAYNHLMSGINHMLPFVTGGGILVALSYFLDRGNVRDITFGSGTSLSWLLGQVGELAFDMMYPILAGFLAVAMAGQPAFLPGAVGGYLAWSGMAGGPQSTWVSSGFWGAILAGAVAGYLIRGLRKLCSRLPAGLDTLKTTLIYPVVGLAVMAFLMIVFINPPLGHFNAWLYDGLESMRGGSRIALGAVLGGMMATDFGGPFNKAAYLFGTVALSGGQQGFMAAVMLGGMVPPLGVALACTFFPECFTKAERHSALMNYLMGFSFITEGALPFALRDPLRVIPSCVAGSALAGALSMAWNCSVPAPHGGLYVLPLAENAPGMLLALALGSVLTAGLLGLLKHPRTRAHTAPGPVKEP